ncbi:hypothetical protein LUZ62_044590 [Rhynchospora pubera]|uniref:KIB1-4 beta-propeller domain-containing protein n=1 Tax=Rhynchospora pubera TaxID=906938 RepID=A0AAV8FNS9_9POAL|nr:hypothetical protein LUZ62_044590 [Rhynchospora pubera]
MVKKQFVGFRDEVRVDEQIRDWSALPDGIVETIGKVLLADDAVNYISFRNVCSYWRKATDDITMTERRFCPRKWILMWGSDEYDPKHFCTKKEQSSKPQRQFLNPSLGKYVRAHIPELRKNKINTCLEGLLLITGPSRGRVTSRLLNPFTGSTLVYPNISRLYNTHARSEIHPPSIIFVNSTSFAILVIATKFMAYAEPGFKEWKVFSLELDRQHPCVFYQDRPYCLSATWGIFPIEREENQKELVKGTERIFITGLPRPLTIEFGGVERYYLVESDGKLFAVLGSYKPGYADIYFRIFRVVNWKIEEDDGTGREMIFFVPVWNIGKNALFIHPWHGGVSISTDVFPCFLSNSIYFYEGGLPAPKIFTIPESARAVLPEWRFCYCIVQNEQFLVSRRFSPFPVAESRRKNHSAHRCF